jgi:hypothetical protein
LEALFIRDICGKARGQQSHCQDNKYEGEIAHLDKGLDVPSPLNAHKGQGLIQNFQRQILVSVAVFAQNVGIK